ncbi:pyridoxamine 5'-phosphate oxidase family protein [Rhodococcus sp. GOMB7]|uniref:pyridoxamine 5'-phosphate oxidase family protein n=1 Tax=Rhodococcus sp. GOMB7 TaxID=2839033 RepID=UPI001BFFDE1B|nr:pyridoxamine 5'-phosphate oxidase family protein [Rhodococcus sp. GOMB7]MBT9295878.1 pyridoxamine 5'-phosphate oxidase family protein [Rhodococcus sp. GOMB7]
MALSENEREQFLAEPHIGALSVADGTERGPLTVPIWYLYSPGGKPWILTRKDSRKARLIESAGHFSLMAERLDPTIRYVSVSGSVDKIVPGTDEMLVEVSRRYLAPDKVDGYLEFARSQLGEQVAIYMNPQHWLSADLGAI